MINFSIFSKPLCRFLIHRYMGQYLKTEITSDQLEIRLADGTATVQSVMLNTEYINEMLAASGLGIVSLVDSYVRELSLSVPWKKLPTDSTIIRICGLQFTLEPLLDVLMSNTQELVTSLIGSIASSMDLAKSFIIDEQLASGSLEGGGGIEQFASVIDQIITRIKFIFEDVVIRIESYSVETGLCTGMEIQIDRMEFLDENLYEQNVSERVVTEQPGRNSTDLNKLLTVKGVRLYTDIWTPVRQHKLNTSQIIPSDSEPDVDSMGNSSLNFQSCYSHFSTRSNSNTTTRVPIKLISPSPILFAQLFTDMHTVRIRTNNNDSSKRIELDVILGSPLYTLLTSSQIYILKSLFMSMLPKVKLPDNPKSNFTGGMPMREEHFTRMMNQMQDEFVVGNASCKAEQKFFSGAGFFNPGTWSGTEPQFFDLSEVDLQTPTNRKHVFHEQVKQETIIHDRLRSNSIKTEEKSTNISATKNRRNDSSTTLVDFRIESFEFSFRAPAALLLVTHEDPLSVDSLKERNSDSETINQMVQTSLNEMSVKSDQFFAIVQSLKLDLAGTNEQKALLSNLYPNSHLRILIHGLFMRYSITNHLNLNSIEFVGHFDGCDISELLKPSDYQTHVLVFSNKMGNASLLSDYALSFQLHNSSPEKQQQHDYSLLIEAGICRLEIDPVIIDRVGKIFTSRSFLSDYKLQLLRQSIFNETPVMNHGVLSDLLENGSQPISLSVLCDCNNLLLVIRSPNFNSGLSDGESDAYLLHTELLHLEFDDVKIELPKSVLTDLEICGTINLKCRTLKGSFIGEPADLKCRQDQMNFIFVETTNADKAMGNVYGVGLKFSYDMRDKSLSRALLLNSMNLSRAMPESIFNPICTDEKKIEGLFSYKDVFHFKDDSSKKKGVVGEEDNPSQMLVKAGSRAELLEFAEDCRAFSNFVIDFTFANVNLAFPSQEFFHMLFNRYLLDLSRWTPKFSKVCSHENAQIESKRNFVECHSAFFPFRDFESDVESSFDEQEDENKNFSNSARLSSTYKSNKKRRLNISNKTNEAHNFSFGIHFERMRFLIKTSSIAVSPTENDLFGSQICTELLNGDLFLVNGFKGSPNINYMFLTSSNAHIFHENLFDVKDPSFGSNVLDTSTFIIQKNRNNVQLSEIPKDHQGFGHIEDDNFVCSLRITFNQETNSKDILLAIGLRNSLLYFRPVESLHLFWPLQLLKFFDCSNLNHSDTPSPNAKVDLRFHCTNVLFGYDHCSIQKNSPFQLRFEIGSSYVRTYLTKNLEQLSFDCIFEDLILWMRKKEIESVTFEPIQARFFNSENIFVKMLASDSIHFVINCHLNNSCQEYNNPIMDFACTDQNLTLWLCSDTLIEFVTIITEFYNSETLKTFLESINSSDDKHHSEFSYTNNVDKDQFNTRTSHLVNKNKVAIDDQQLISEMEAAITDMPPIFRASEQDRCVMTESIFDQKLFDVLSNESDCEDDENIAGNEDSDEFTFIEIPTEMSTKVSSSSQKNGVGITKMNEGRFHTNFDAIGGFEFIAKTIRLASMKSYQDKPKLPSSAIKASYKISFSTLKILIFGGSDFSNSARHLPHRCYSQCDSSHREYCSTVADDYGSKGGRYRDHTVFVEIKLTKLSTVCKFFNGEVFPYRFSFLLELGDLNILDHLSISHINEMIHRLQIEGQPRSQGHFLKIFLQEDQLREAVVRISLAPIRLNLDQDTFDFIVDFKNQIVQYTKNIFENLLLTSMKINKNMEYDDVPIMEVPPPRSSSYVSEEIHKNLYPETSEEECPMSFSKLKEQDESNLADLFSEDDVDFSDFNEKSRKETMQSSGEVTESFRNKRLSQSSTSTMRSTTISLKRALAAKDIFIKDFSFSPACLIRVDYEAKRIRTDQHQSAFLSLLLGLTNMKKAELVLKEIHVEKGFLGARKCVQFVVDEWKNDIIDRQLRNLVGGVAMINAVVLLAQGLSDLITYPLEEYQRVDGQLSRGIQKGTSSFGLNAASAAIDATQRMMGFVHNIAEFTYDILNPNFVYQHYDQRIQAPGDLREGFSLACNTVKEGFSDTAQTLQIAAEQDRARGGWGVGILRHVAPTAVRPIVIATKATVHMLGGLKNQLKPEEHREEMRKWRNSVRISTGEQLKRQSSAPSIPSTISGSSFTHISNDLPSSSSQMNWQTQK